MKDYVNLKRIETSIEIRSQTAQNWIRKLRNKYKDIHKNLFIDGHEHSNLVNDPNNFLTWMEDLKPHMVEIEENGEMKRKNYPFVWAVRDDDCWLIIVITYDECTFSVKHRIRRA